MKQDFIFDGFDPANTTPVPDVCWMCEDRLWHWRKERPDGLCDRCSGALLSKVIRQKKRARIRGRESTLTLAQWTMRLKDSQGHCFYCGEYFGYRALTLEHIKPIAKGGGTTAENCVPACMSCNWDSWMKGKGVQA